MVNQRRYKSKRGKKTHRRKTRRVRKNMRGGFMDPVNIPVGPPTFHDQNQQHNFSMGDLIPPEDRVGPSRPFRSNTRKISDTRKIRRKKAEKSRKKNKGQRKIN